LSTYRAIYQIAAAITAFSILISEPCSSKEVSVHPFESFLQDFIPHVSNKNTQLNKAIWILETTGNKDAADLKADLDTEYRLLFNNPDTYKKLLEWDEDSSIQDPLLKRQLNVLIRNFKQNLILKELVEEIAQKEAALAQSYANFRPEIEGVAFSENSIREILKNDNNPTYRKKVWEASKQIGGTLAPKILELVSLRNKAAKSLGYDNYFQMQVDLQEVDGEWLLSIFDDLAQKTDSIYEKVIQETEETQAQRFEVARKELGPWAWSEPFCQEDPMDAKELDSLVVGVDIPEVVQSFYKKMGFDVGPTLQRSDMFEREGKNQHAFCMDIDREGDVRTLNNVKPTIKWLETVLHELGHAIYDLGFDPKLPWLLRDIPHMIPTEAMALLAGRQAYRYNSLSSLVGKSEEKDLLIQKAATRLHRGQLIFSRWVLVMTHFESSLYQNPHQDLNDLWWTLVEKYQKIARPQGREGEDDWAAKYHLGLAPVYYFSYLLGEMFASAIEETLLKVTGSKEICSEKAGHFLQDKLFFPGNRMNWNELIHHVTGETLSPDAWVRQFAQN